MQREGSISYATPFKGLWFIKPSTILQDNLNNLAGPFHNIRGDKLTKQLANLVYICLMYGFGAFEGVARWKVWRKPLASAPCLEKYVKMFLGP
jgi:hypothetical protein